MSIYLLKGDRVKSNYYQFWVDNASIGFISHEIVLVLKEFENVFKIEENKYFFYNCYFLRKKQFIRKIIRLSLV